MKKRLILSIALNLILSAISNAQAQTQQDAHVQAYRQKGASVWMREQSEDLKTFIFTFASLSDRVLHGLNVPLRACALERDQTKWNAKVLKIEGLFKKYNTVEDRNPEGFIPLPEGRGEIAKTGVSQELWVEVMGNNPSVEKTRTDCADTYREVQVGGRTIGMCPDFPVTGVSAQRNPTHPEGQSDEEFFVRLNQFYENAGLKTRFRRQDQRDFFFADTANETQLKRTEHALLRGDHPNYLGKFMPYWKGKGTARKPRSFQENAPNSLGFRRSGAWEFVNQSSFDEETQILMQRAVGGSYYRSSGVSVSDYHHEFEVFERVSDGGPSRPVRIK